jgi:hypothetical protein
MGRALHLNKQSFHVFFSGEQNGNMKQQSWGLSSQAKMGVYLLPDLRCE